MCDSRLTGDHRVLHASGRATTGHAAAQHGGHPTRTDTNRVCTVCVYVVVMLAQLGAAEELANVNASKAAELDEAMQINAELLERVRLSVTCCTVLLRRHALCLPGGAVCVACRVLHDASCVTDGTGRTLLHSRALPPSCWRPSVQRVACSFVRLFV